MTAKHNDSKSTKAGTITSWGVSWAMEQPWSGLGSATAGTVATMTAQPLDQAGPDDPAEILAVLPEPWHAQFLAEYRAALADAQEVRRWHELADLLHRWHLRALSYSDPEFEASMQEARDARPEDLVTVPGWPFKR